MDKPTEVTDYNLYTTTELKEAHMKQAKLLNRDPSTVYDNLRTTHNRCNMLLHKLEKAEAEVNRLRNGIQKYLDGDYPCPASHECPHNLYRWEECSQCDDMYFSALIKDKRNA